MTLHQCDGGHAVDDSRAAPLQAVARTHSPARIAAAVLALAAACAVALACGWPVDIIF